VASPAPNPTHLTELAVAIVVDPSLGPGRTANAAAVVAIGLGAAAPQLAGLRLTDADGKGSDAISLVPVPILQADSGRFGVLLERAMPTPEACHIVLFPAFSTAIHDPSVYLEEAANRRLSTETYAAVGLAGPKKWVRSLTGSLKLL
jgi:hypothetical protein